LEITGVRTIATPARGVRRADVIEQLCQPISGVLSTHRPYSGRHAACRNVTLPVQTIGTNTLVLNVKFKSDYSVQNDESLRGATGTVQMREESESGIRKREEM